MKNISKILNFFYISGSILLGNYELYGQSNSPIKKITEDTLLTKIVDCNALFTLNTRKVDYLGKKPYIYAEPYYEKVYNSKKDFAVFQLIKRKGVSPLLFFKMFRFNTCIKKDQVMEFVTAEGYRYRLKNNYKPNCDGYLMGKIRRRDSKNLTQGNISSIKILTFDKDYEFHLQTNDSERIKDELQCLKNKRFKFK
jgi:hypothetical protein